LKCLSLHDKHNAVGHAGTAWLVPSQFNSTSIRR